MKTKDNIDELLAKHFAGEKMPDEQTEILNRWIELNYDEYRKIKQLMDVKIDNNLDCFDTEKAWSKIEKQLEDKTDIRRHNYKKISTFSIAVISAVAAVVAIVIMHFDIIFLYTRFCLLTILSIKLSNYLRILSSSYLD